MRGDGVRIGVAMFSAADTQFMRMALALAGEGEGRVEPNPMVGAVIVKDGRVIGAGYHRRFGGPHAEVEALRSCRRSPRGATCYVTLEPCCHWGKTPPCTDALIAAGVRRVVAAVRDPFPAVRGGGFRTLRAAGVEVAVGLLRDDALRQNAPFFKLQRCGRPWVILKWAQSLDGRIATRSGDSKWISSPASRRAAHRLRGRVDAIIVGIGTVLADDPQLTCRLGPRLRVATRVVLDASARTPTTAALVRSARRTPTLIAVGTTAPASRVRRLERAGCEVLGVAGSTDLVALPMLLDELGRRRMTNVLVEGGSAVLGAFVDAGLADEAIVFVAPRIVGGAAAPGALGGAGAVDMAHLPRIGGVERFESGPDLAYQFRFRAR